MRRRLMGVVALVAIMILGVAIAQAGKGILTSFGSFGGGAGEFDTPRGLAVNTTSGDVYVADPGNQRVDQFDGDGSFVRTWGWGVQDGSPTFQTCASSCQGGSPDGGAGGMSSPQGVAVNSSTGDVYVMDRDNLRVQQFEADGDFVRAWGWGVADGTAALQVCAAPGPCQAGIAGDGDGQFAATGVSSQLAVDLDSGAVYVADPGNGRVQKFGASGAFLDAFGGAGSGDGEFGADSPTQLAVDSNGDVYAVDGGNERVQRFDSAGTFEAIFAAGALSGAPAPTDIAVDPSNDHLLVGKGCNSTLCPDDHDVADERRIFELDAAGALVDTHMSDAGITDTGGVAVNATGSRIYVTSTNDGHQVYVLENVAPPTASIDVVDVGPHGATVEGTVNPQGMETSYRFEYSTDGIDWTRATFFDQDAGAGMTDVAVGFEAAGLDANTEYQMRLVAEHPSGNPGATATETFTTDAIAPSVDVASTTASDETAVLRARVNPNGSATEYRFEYGPTASYGSSVPAVDASVGDGGQLVLVQEQVVGLERDSVYHYRVVATSTAGTSVSPDRTVATGPGLSNGRQYERVSPAEKNGSDVMIDATRARAADGGEAVVFASLGAFGDVHGTGISTEYVSRRTDDGWSTHGITPPLPEGQEQALLSFQFDAQYVGDFSDDLSTGVFISRAPLTTNASNVDLLGNLYLRRNLLEPGGGTYQLLSDAAAPVVADPTYRPWLAGASEDFSHVLFTAALNLTAEAPAQPLFCVLLGSGCRPRLYEFVDGAVRLVGILPATEGGGPAVRSIAGGGLGFSYYTPNTISRDGRRIVFTVGDTNVASEGGLYMREDGSSTIKLNASEKQVPDAEQPARYWDASADGATVYFTSEEQLTDTPGSGLYRYDREAPEGERLTLLSIDGEPRDPPGDIEGVLGVGADGGYVYFAGHSQLVAGAPLPAPGEMAVFVWHDGEVRFVGMLSAGDDFSNIPIAHWTLIRKESRVSPDGRRLVFTSRSSHQPLGYDHGTACNEVDNRPCSEVYVYDATAADGEGMLACASCRPSGEMATADATTMPKTATGASTRSSRLNTALTDDGRRVFFTTGDGLVPKDVNGTQDAYLYDVEQGQLHLLSRGRGKPAYLLDASANGDDAFIATREQLVASDDDNNVDLYDVRVGGGFGEPPPPPAPCAGAACQGAESRPPQETLPGSYTFRGAEPPSESSRVFQARRLTRSQLQRLGAGLGVQIAVRVFGPGRVTARLRGRIGGRMRSIDISSKASRGGGVVRLRLALSPRAIAHLRRQGRLRIAVSVGHSRRRGVQRSQATLTLARGAVR